MTTSRWMLEQSRGTCQIATEAITSKCWQLQEDIQETDVEYAEYIECIAECAYFA